MHYLLQCNARENVKESKAAVVEQANKTFNVMALVASLSYVKTGNVIKRLLTKLVERRKKAYLQSLNISTRLLLKKNVKK